MSEKDLTRLIEIIERALGREWIDASEWLRGLDSNSLDAIEARLISGDYAGLVREVEAAARTFAAATHAAFERAARAEAKWLDKQADLADKLIRFDAKNDQAVFAARTNELKNVSGLAEEMRESIQAALVDGQAAGTNPRQVARRIRSSIGLTKQQGAWVDSYQRALEEGRYADALSRELRDERSDKLLRRLQRSRGKESLTDKQIESLTERYRKNQLRYRAEMIARTESARNVHAGSMESFRQAIERGDLEASDIVREWHPGPVTKHARKDHRSSVLLDQRPAWGVRFKMPNGAEMLYPGDEQGGASNTIHCRCTVSTTLG